MSVQELSAQAPGVRAQTLEWALAQILGRAGELDRNPRFPEQNFRDLALAGALSSRSEGLVAEVGLVRAVAHADASTARILDGHLNGVERLRQVAGEPLRSTELGQIEQGELLLGVWGADPGEGEGPPARLRRAGARLVLRGCKTFCSGAGGVQRALVVARAEDGARHLAYLGTSPQLAIDRSWYRGSGLRSSESHRVEFHDAPVLALLGGPEELSREPYFSRDAIRSTAIWAGLADRILEETVAALEPARLQEIQGHALGRMRVARATINRWLEHTATELESPTSARSCPDPAALALECRVAIQDSALVISSLSARICGSRALIGDTALDRARRDLDLFLLQHRLDGKIAGLGAETLKDLGQ